MTSPVNLLHVIHEITSLTCSDLDSNAWWLYKQTIPHLQKLYYQTIL